MKIKFLALLFMATIALSACAPAEPTLSPADVAGTAAAQAWLSVTQTAGAMPTPTFTETPAPPTETLAPTATLFPTLAPLPTQPAEALPTATAGVDPCNDVPPAKPLGATGTVTFVNKSEGQVNLSFGLYKENDKKECGTYSFAISRYDQPTYTVLAGCYWAYGWVNGDKPSTTSNIEAICITSGGNTKVIISKEVVSPY